MHHAPSADCPNMCAVLMLHGTHDLVCSVDRAKLALDAMPAKDKTWVPIEGAWHDLEFDYDRECAHAPPVLPPAFIMPLLAARQNRPSLLVVLALDICAVEVERRVRSLRCSGAIRCLQAVAHQSPGVAPSAHKGLTSPRGPAPPHKQLISWPPM
jgi:Serine aminopeptidase, S33